MMMLSNLRAGGLEHWKKYKARGERMPIAIVLGCAAAGQFPGTAEAAPGR